MSKPIQIKIDFADWEGSWGDEIMKAIKFEKTEYGITMELDVDSYIFREAADRIAKKAIEAFIVDFFTAFTFSEGGITLSVLEQDGEVVVPWDTMRCRQNAETFNAIAEFAVKKRKQWEDALAVAAEDGELPGDDEELYPQ